MRNRTKQRHSGLAERFLHSAGLSASALLLSAGVAFAQETQAPPAPSFSFDPQILCNDAKGLHAVKSTCYSTLAEEMTAYAKDAAAQYLQAATIDDVVRLLGQQNPAPSVEVDREKQIIFARWQDADGELHREGSPAYIKIDFAKKEYTEMWFQNGSFTRANAMPTYVKYALDRRIKLQWDERDQGLHNEKGPVIVEYNIDRQEMALKWSLRGHSFNPVAPKSGPTYAEVNLGSNVAYFQEFSSGSGGMHNRRHRNDCVHTQNHNRETGMPEQITYMYHDQDFMTDDEFHVTVNFSNIVGEAPEIKWSKGGHPVDPPTGFSLPADSYCKVPGLPHPAAKYQR